MAQWNLDTAHSSVNFSVRHMVISKVRGHFTQFSGTLDFDEARPQAAKLEVKVQTASVNTNDAQRDGHLKSADFFDVEKYPEMTYKSSAVEVVDKNHFRVQGQLTLHGVTKPVTLDVEYAGHGRDPWGGDRAGFTATAGINRKDFGLNWNQALEAGGVLVSDQVEITLEIQAVAAQAKAAS
jgi:polyisoprenoid-binding protein YceI